MTYEKFTYELNKQLDEEYDTPVNSPLHRSSRFPKEYAEEMRRLGQLNYYLQEYK